MTAPLVSLIICCYNRAHLLPKTLESAFAQSYQPIEIIVFDDGSEDDTEQLMASYSDRVHYYRQQNQGVSAARSNACRLAKGEYIAFLDDDDFIPTERINLLMAALKEYPQAIFAVGDLEIIDDEDQLTGKRWLPKNHLGTQKNVLFGHGDEAVLWPHVPATPHTTLFRKTDGEKIGWFDIKYRFAAEDKDFFARLGRLGPVAYVPEVVSHYRCGHSSLTNNNNLRTFYSQLLLFESHLHKISPKREKFRRHLQQRILQTLIKIQQNKNMDSFQPDNVANNDFKRAMALLNLGDKLKYFWVAWIKHPIKMITSRK